jgi:hypothetical protein
MESNNVGVYKTGFGGNRAGARIALSMPLSVPAFSASAPSNVIPQSQIAGSLQPGDLVRLRSGGPLMTVNGIRGNQVIAFGQAWMESPTPKAFPPPCS